MKKRKVAIATGAAGLLLLGGGAALADATGIPGSPGGIFGTFAEHTVAVQDGVVLNLKPHTEVSHLVKTYLPFGENNPNGTPGWISGWHHHPGVVIATVQSGSVERKVLKPNGTCVTEKFVAGDSFTEVEPHNVLNVSATDSTTNKQLPAVLSITALHPEAAKAFTTAQQVPTHQSCQFTN